MTPQTTVFSLHSFLVTFTISVEGNWGVIGRAVRLAVYCQPQMVNAGRGDAPKGASPSLG